MRRPSAAAGSALFFAVAPGTVAGLVPWALTGWEVEAEWWPPLRVVGVVLVVAAAAVLVHAFVRFVIEGLGTPAPLAPCWYCSGMIRQFGIGTVVVGESRTFQGGIDWLRECGVQVVDLDSSECHDLLAEFIARHPEVWNEDIGE